MIAEAVAPVPVEYLPTGDHALLMAWVVTPSWIEAVLCLEDGTATNARLSEFKFDYRWSEAKQQFVDVSAIGDKDAPEEGEEVDEGADTDQAAPDDGGSGVPGPVPEADEARAGDPGQPGD